MQSHGPKRIYTPRSVEFWFEKLSNEWESTFSPRQLDEGARIYRHGEVRELELTDTDAIVHRRVEKKDEYAVIEWRADGLNVRSSSTDLDVARALAVAGMHEIEELVADEISPLPGDRVATEGLAPATAGAPAPSNPISPGDSGPISETTERHDSNGSNGHAGAGAVAPSVGRTSSAPAASRGGETQASSAVVSSVRATGAGVPPARATGSVNGGPARPLILVFRTRPEGLVFQAFWLNPDKSRIAAHGSATHASGAGYFTSSERAKLIGLAAYARKAHFAYNAASGEYTLSSVVEIPNFLKGTLPAWKRLFGVELDDDSSRLLQGPLSIEIEAVAERRGSRGSGAGSLDLRWIFRAGERMLTDEEVAAVTRSGTNPMILPSLGIVTLPAEKLASVNAWQKNVADFQTDGAISPYLIFSLFNDSKVKLTISPELEAWRQQVLSPSSEPRALPSLLRPYQKRGVEWLWHLCETGCHGLLADEMGLGKTLQVLTLLSARGISDRPNLIVCPASVVPVWREEAARFFPALEIEVLKTNHDFSTHKEPVLWLASYTQLRKHRALLDAVDFGYAVLDEGQFIKNPDAKVTQTCFAIRARHRVVLTGTPLENRQLDLWSIFRFLLPGLLGSRAGFEAALGADRAATLERLRAQLAPFILRRTKDEVATELPPKVEVELICPMTDVQRTEYARICAEGLQRLGDDVGTAIREKSFGFLALLTRLRQVCCDPNMLPWLRAPLSDSGKINLLVEKLAEVVSNGHKAVIFSQFVMLLDRVKLALAQSFPDLPRYELTGMTLDRQKPVQGFQNAPGAAAMLVSLKAAGTGITLHAADYVFLLDPWWNPAVEAQAVDRVHRIGQKSTVFVYRMVTGGTIEARIEALKASKRDLFDKLVGGLGGDFDLSQHFTSLQELTQLTSGVTDPTEISSM
ncbi:MAG: DEAD/DEAH box helicase [Opitutaceae bacterium]|nr:DEAD/DEAH box helicase [Opitutaceae bacterium]